MGTSGYELQQSLSKSRVKIPFIIRSKDNLKPSDYREPMIGIVNMEDSNMGSGTHWIGFIVPSPSKTVNGIPTASKNYAFDSFGVAPPKEVVKFLKTNGRPIVYSDRQMQKLDSDTCGEHVISWLRYMTQYMTGKPDQILENKYLNYIYNVLDPADLESNDKKVMDKVRIRTQ